MALTKIGDLYIPDVWLEAIREQQATFPSILNSGAVARNSKFDLIATGNGITANIPVWQDITDQDDENQVEDTAPVTTNKIGQAKMICVPTNRVWKGGATALADQLNGNGDPIDEIGLQLAQARDKRRQKRIIATVRGAFAATAARNAAAALSACRYGGVVSEPFDETGLDATNEQKFNPDMFIYGKALMGELSGSLRNGLLAMHTNVKARLEVLDKDNFKTGKPSDLPFEITTYRDIPIIVSDALARACTNDGGFVYDTYLFGPRTIAWGAKAQVGGQLNNPIKDVASLNMGVDGDKNNEYIWDRNREIIHVNGMKWTGAAADPNMGPTNAELQTAGNWALAFQTANRVGVVCWRTNG